MTNRRTFLKNSAVITSGSLLLPRFLAANHKLQKQDFKGRRLVVVQLGGGNDGLNTVVPYRNDLYYKYRPNISIKKDDVIKLSNDLGLNPSMEKLRSIYDQGELLFINNVGYPNPNRSHFRSMDIWQSASDSAQYLRTGWLGRALDSMYHNNKPYFGFESGEMLSLAMKGNSMKGMAVENIDRLYRSSQDQFLMDISNTHKEDGNAVDYLYKTYQDTRDSASYLKEKIGIGNTVSNFPGNPFSKSLHDITQLINAGVETKIYYASATGFDTHARQLGQHNNLLRQVSESLSAFVEELKSTNQFDSTLILVFSEFGRRVKENGSFGTDHGTANNLWLIGGKLNKTGFLNEGPDLTNLEDFDLTHSVDFRSVYATILEHWLDVDSENVLGNTFGNLEFI